MNRSFRIFFSTIPVIRFVCIPAVFIIPELWHNSLSDHPGFSGGIGIDLDIEWWQYLLGYMIVISYPANTIISLLISFKPKWVFTGFLKRKIILQIFYIAELIIIPFFIYIAVQRIQDIFFPPESESSYYLTHILKLVFPGDGISIYEKLEVINMGILVLCSLLFIVFFWNFYKARKKTYSEAAI